jgi:protein ImuB
VSAVRVACVDLPALPLQLLWRRHPPWREHPVVVVDEDRPQGEVLWACERARRLRVLPGQRYAHALSLARGLRAGVVAAAEIAAAVDDLAAALRRRSPSVEPARDAPGSFWLDGDGLARIFGDASAWARAIAGVLDDHGLIGAVVVGFTRFGTHAIARAQRTGVRVFERDADERAVARAVPLERLDVDPALRDALARLGVTTLGEMVRLPGGGILERFGHDAHRLYQLAAGDRWDPLVPEPPPDAPDEQVLLDDPERDVERLLFSVKAAVDRLLARLATRRRAVVALWLELTIQHYGRPEAERFDKRAECLRAAEPTLDGRALLRLCHLRLEGGLFARGASGPGALGPSSGVIQIRVWADDVGATREQLALFAARPRRDLRAAADAVARLRAELGDDAVVKAVVRDGHLPEARFGWEPVTTIAAPRPRPSPLRLLIRRIQARPRLLAPQTIADGTRTGHVRNDGWVLAGLEQGSVVRIDGPYIVSGGWWMAEAPGAQEIHREYHFAETLRGDCVWLYFDRRRRRWFQHGAVE